MSYLFKPVSQQPRTRKGELYLVPPEMVARAWHPARYVMRGPKSGIGRDYDFNRLHGRLVLGIDQLWMAAFIFCGQSVRDLCPGVVITSIGPPPKDLPRRLFDRKDSNSLTVHFIAGWSIEAWMPDAIEKIAAYGKKHDCKQIFALARLNWLRYLFPFYSRFERVGLARDRMTTRGRDIKNAQQRPGHFRLLCKDLPPRMSYDCARHSRNRIYIPPTQIQIKEGQPHGDERYDVNARNAAALTATAQ